MKRDAYDRLQAELDARDDKLASVNKAVEEKKETNPKDALGVKKWSMANVPIEVVMELGLAMHEGALKYGRFNWRDSGVRASVYFDAALRHLFSWWTGQDIDPDSGVHHLTKAMACFAIVLDAAQFGKLEDDRPAGETPSAISRANVLAAALVEKYGSKP